jgi:hypothetical protein
VLFPLLGVLYIVVFCKPSNWPAYLLLSSPLVLIGILFWLNWHYRTEFQAQQAAGAPDPRAARRPPIARASR